MPTLDTLTASEILAIAPGEPERLFSGDPVSRLDLESIRAVGRTILGDSTGLGLVGRADLPKPMARAHAVGACRVGTAGRTP